MSRGEDDEEEVKEGDDEEKVFRAAAATFPINNKIISSEIRRVMSAIKIDPRLWWTRAGKTARDSACAWTRTHTSPSDLPMIIEHS